MRGGTGYVFSVFLCVSGSCSDGVVLLQLHPELRDSMFYI